MEGFLRGVQLLRVINAMIPILAVYAIIVVPTSLLAWLIKATTDRTAAVFLGSGVIAFLEAVILFVWVT